MHRDIYRPKVIIDYEREAYVYEIQNIRVTLDKNLRTSWNCGIYLKDLCMVPLINEDIYVLEIKCDHIIPVLRRILSISLCKSQITKYCLGREM